MLSEYPNHSIRDRFLLLKALPSLAGLDDDGFSLLAEHTRSRYFEKGDVVLQEGHPIEVVRLVVQGRIRVMRNGKLYTMVERPHGVGFISVLARDPQGVQAEAVEDTQTLEVPVSVLLSAFEKNFSLLRNTLRLSANSLMQRRGNLPVRPERAAPVELGEYVERSETLVERILQISKTPLFARCNVEAVVDIARGIREVRVEPGHVFWEVGDPPDFNLRVKYGCVRCENAKGEHVEVGSGFVLGALDPLGDLPRSYRAVAKTKIVAFVGEKNSFLSALETHHDVAMELLSTFAQAHLAEGSEASE